MGLEPLIFDFGARDDGFEATTRKAADALKRLGDESELAGKKATQAAGSQTALSSEVTRSVAGYVKFGNASRATVLSLQDLVAGGDRAAFALSAMGTQLVGVASGLANSGSAMAGFAAKALPVAGAVAGIGAAAVAIMPSLIAAGEALGDLIAGAAGHVGGLGMSRATADAMAKETEQLQKQIAANEREIAAIGHRAFMADKQKELEAEQKTTVELKQRADVQRSLAKQLSDAERTYERFIGLPPVWDKLLPHEIIQQNIDDVRAWKVAVASTLAWVEEGLAEAQARDREGLLNPWPAAEMPTGELMNPWSNEEAFVQSAEAVRNLEATLNEVVAEFPGGAMAQLILGPDNGQTALADMNAFQMQMVAAATAVGAAYAGMAQGVAAAVGVALGPSVRFVRANKEAARQAKAMELSSTQAFQATTREVLKGTAMQAASKSIFALAEGFMALGNPFTAPFAPFFFKAAAMYALVAGATGGLAAGISPVTKTIPDRTSRDTGGAGAGEGSSPFAGGGGRGGAGEVPQTVYVSVRVEPGSSPDDTAAAIERMLRNRARETGRPLTFEP